MRRILPLLLLCVLASPARALGPAFLFAFGSAGPGTAQFQSPHGLAAAPDGTIYVGDTVNGRVQHFSAAGAAPPAVAARLPGGGGGGAGGPLALVVPSTDHVRRDHGDGRVPPV